MLNYPQSGGSGGGGGGAGASRDAPPPGPGVRTRGGWAGPRCPPAPPPPGGGRPPPEPQSSRREGGWMVPRTPSSRGARPVGATLLPAPCPRAAAPQPNQPRARSPPRKGLISRLEILRPPPFYGCCRVLNSSPRCAQATCLQVRVPKYYRGLRWAPSSPLRSASK